MSHPSIASPAALDAALAASTCAAVVMPAHHSPGPSGWFLMAASTSGLEASLDRQAIMSTAFRAPTSSAVHGPDGLYARRGSTLSAASAFAFCLAAFSVPLVATMIRLEAAAP